MSERLWVVRVRGPRFAWTSEGMAESEALEVRRVVLRTIRDIGDGAEMFEFRAREDRIASVRAREVLSVELEPWQVRRDPEREGRPAVEPAPDGTSFLRQQARCET